MAGEHMDYELKCGYDYLEIFFSVREERLEYLNNNYKYQDILLRQNKGNIPVKSELLNIYANDREIFDSVIGTFCNIRLVSNCLYEFNIADIYKLKINEIKKIAKEIFNRYNATNIFFNDGNKIFINKTGIDEVITKIYESREQRKYLIQHLIIIANMCNIVEHGILVNQALEFKGRDKYNNWNYYLDVVNITGELYILVYDVVSMTNGENHYRIQKIEKIKKQRFPLGVQK